MRKSAKSRVKGLIFGFFAALLAFAAMSLPAAGYSALSDTLVERARSEVARIKALVDDGTLPKTRLEEAQVALADAEDEAILAQTLYGQTRIQDMTPDQASSDVGCGAAAGRPAEQDRGGAAKVAGNRNLGAIGVRYVPGRARFAQ